MTLIVKIMPNDLTQSRRRDTRTNRLVAIVAYEGVNAFELGMALEVFSLKDMGPNWYQIVLCADRPGRKLDAGNGLQIVVDEGLEALKRAGTIIVPGWRNVDALPPPRLLEALGAAHKRKARIVSICSGVFVLGAAGLLDGRRVTAHWAEADKLARRHPRLQVDPNVLYVDDGDILSSAGRAAGLDLCLHIVRRDYGMNIANHVARRLVVAPHRDGGQAQFIPQPVRPATDPLIDVYAWARQNIDRDLAVANLAAKARMSRRTFIRRFTAATGLSPGEWVMEARVKEAQILLETNDLSVEQVATAAGFGSADALRHHFRTRLHTSPQRYRNAFRGLRRTTSAPMKISGGRVRVVAKVR